MLINQAAINLTTLDENTHIEGGEIVKENGELTGLLIDQAMRFVGEVIPEPSLKETVLAIKDAEKICFDYGLTTVDDAGLPREAIHLIDSLQQIDELKIRVYAMASAYKENLDYFLFLLDILANFASNDFKSILLG